MNISHSNSTSASTSEFGWHMGFTTICWTILVWLQEYILRNFFSVMFGTMITLYIHQNMKPIVIKALLGQENNFLAHQRSLLWVIYLGMCRL